MELMSLVTQDVKEAADVPDPKNLLTSDYEAFFQFDDLQS